MAREVFVVDDAAAVGPCRVMLQAGKKYAWCRCSHSQKQPFCDGSHRGTAFSPLVFKAEETKEVWLCRCKKTKTEPHCDGTHSGIR